MIRAASRLPRTRRSRSNAARTPAKAAASVADKANVTAPPSDEPCDAAVPPAMCVDVPASERSRRHVTGLEPGFTSGARVVSAATRVVVRSAVARAAAPARPAVARRSTSPPLRLVRRNDCVGRCELPSPNDRVRTSSASRGTPTAGAAFEAAAPASSAGAVSRAPTSFVVSDATSAARGDCSCTDGGGGSAAFDLAGDSTVTAGDAGAATAATGGSDRAVGDVRDGKRGTGST
jgi:hypothetical protein